MVKLLTYSNILDPLAQKTQEINAKTAYEALEKLHVDTSIYEVVVARNQIITKEDFEILDGDIVSITLVPLGGDSGKDVVRAVAFIAVAIYAPYLAGTYMGYGAGAAVASAVMVTAGSMVINAVLPPQTETSSTDTLDNLETSSTYSWDTRGNEVSQGAPVPMLYGRHRVTPPQISHYIETVDNLQYINILYAVADGVTTLHTSTIQVNGEPIDNLSDVSVYTRNGRNNQSIIGIFDDVHTDKAIDKKLSTDWVYSETDGNSVSGLEIGLVASQGIWYINDYGDIVDYSVEVKVEYYYNGQWIPLGRSTEIDTDISGYWIKATISGYKKFATYYEALYYSENDGGQTVIDTSTDLPINTRPAITVVDGYTFISSTVFEEYTETPVANEYDIITSNKQEVLRKSYKVNGLPDDKYKIRVKFNTAPEEGTRYGSDMYLSYLQEIVTDDFTYPNTALLGLRILATNQLSGSMPVVSIIAENSMNNPSDVCRDILEKGGTQQSNIDIEKFDEWAEYCNEKNLTCNIYFDAIYTGRKPLDIVGLLGRGNPIQYGNTWSVIIDKPDETPIQGFLFTMGNIVKDSFSESFLPLQDRANKIEITYYDEEVEYEPQVLEVSNANYDDVDNVNAISITYLGCTSRDMALKYAKFLLNCNRLLTITQTFEVDTEAIVCRVGSIIKVAHDVPKIGSASGRIVAATKEEVTIDSEVTLEEGIDYYIDLRYSETDEIITESIVNTETTTDTFTFTTQLATAPTKYDVFSIGAIGKVTKKMRVVSITSTSKQRSKISAIEYIEDVYNDIEQIVPHTESDFNLTGLALYEAISYNNANVISDIDASWRGTSLWYDILIGDVFYQRVYKDSIKIADINAPATYKITVKDSFGKEASKEITLQGRFAQPEPTTNFTVVQNDNIVRFNWTKSVSMDVVKYEIRSGVSWDTGFKIGVVGNVDTFEWFPDFNHTYNFWIKALDASDVYSVDTEQQLLTVAGINETLNIIYEYDGLDTVTPPCGDTVGLVFVVGVGYVPIITASYDDIPLVTYDDIQLVAYDDIPSFEGCQIDTKKIGITKIRMLLDYSATSGDFTYLDIPLRTYESYQYDTYDAMTTINSVKLYYAYSDDDVTYSAWIEYTGIVDETFRYMRFKYEFVDEVNGSISISDFKGYLDVPDVEFNITDLEVNTSISILFADYGYSFYDAPHISITTKTNTYGKITNIDNLGFTIDSYNPTDGSALVGTYDINIKGY